MPNASHESYDEIIFRNSDRHKVYRKWLFWRPNTVKKSTAAERNFKQSTTLICVEIFCTWVGRFLWISRFYMNSTWLVVEQALVQWTTQYSIEFKLAFWTLLHLDTVANDIAWFYITVIHSHWKRFFMSNLKYWKYCDNILDKVISSISSPLLKNTLVTSRY